MADDRDAERHDVRDSTLMETNPIYEGYQSQQTNVHLQEEDDRRGSKTKLIQQVNLKWEHTVYV